MADTDSSPRMTADRTGPVMRPSGQFDAVVIGASLAGCTTATLLGRAGLRVALVEKRPDPAAFKRICTHYVQASAVPTLERLDLLEPILGAGALRSRFRIWSRWGWIEPPPPERAALAVNLRRSLLDPLVRRAAAETPGVELMLGHAAAGLLRDGDAVAGALVRTPAGAETRLRAPLVVGADGRDSKVAELAGVREKVLPHGRIAYAGYFAGEPPHGSDASIWLLDPNWGAAFPTDHGLTSYAAMPTKEMLPQFRRDPTGTLISYVNSLPDASPVSAADLVEPVLGKVEMPNRVRRTTAPGLALVGDAALATDPLFGIGCGWALQSGEWLADAVAPALRGEERLERALRRYGRTHKRRLAGHAWAIHDYATGRRMRPGERAFFAAAARDPKMAELFDRFGSRQVGPARTLAAGMPRAIAVNLRHARRHRGSPTAAP